MWFYKTCEPVAILVAEIKQTMKHFFVSRSEAEMSQNGRNRKKEPERDDHKNHSDMQGRKK